MQTFPVPHYSVGIISVNKNSLLNYGAILQSYALQHYLASKGCSSILIDNITPDQAKHHPAFPTLEIIRHANLRELVAGIISIPQLLSRKIKFSRFIRKHYIKTKRCYTQGDLLRLKSLECTADIWLCGSDIIWKKCSYRDFYLPFFLQIPCANGQRKVAYAASGNQAPLSDEDLNRIKKYTADFASISIREASLANYLDHKLSCPVTWVLDPTFLLPAEAYADITKPCHRHKYLFLYICVRNDLTMINLAEQYAVQNGLKIIEASIFTLNQIKRHRRAYCEAGIEEWLGYLSGADIVFTNSSHGASFSILFHKEFYLFERDKTDRKMADLMESFGISDHFVDCDRKVIPVCPPIDYDPVDLRLKEYRKRSADYLQHAVLDHISAEPNTANTH